MYQQQKVIFGRSNTAIGLMIRVFTNSKFNHVGLLSDDESYVIEADLGHGVIKTDINSFLERYPEAEIGVMPSYNTSEKTMELAHEDIGAKYDIIGVLGLALRLCTAQKIGKFFCSEHVAQKTGLFREKWRVTPQDIYNISKTDQIITK